MVCGMAKISFELQNRLSELETLCEHLGAFCESCGMTKKQKFEINLALDELFTNIISHGFEDSDEHRIEVTCSKNRDEIKIIIRDDGIAFNPTEAPRPNLKCAFDDRAIGGLGIHLIRAYMDSIDYQRQGAQNVLTLIKRLKS
jgi:anti-sigma regulatory factor (Ser/Thr protein kinase)